MQTHLSFGVLTANLNYYPCVSVQHAREIAEILPGSQVVEAVQHLVAGKPAWADSWSLGTEDRAVVDYLSA